MIPLGPALLGSGLRRFASPLRASGGHFDTCGDSRIFGRNGIPPENASHLIRACGCELCEAFWLLTII